MAKDGLSITFREGVGVEEIHRAVEQLIVSTRPGGCGRCGLIGFDMLLTAAVDPEPYMALQAAELRENPDVLQVAYSNPKPVPW
jgi:hypothetical protein